MRIFVDDVEIFFCMYVWMYVKGQEEKESARGVGCGTQRTSSVFEYFAKLLLL